MSGDKTIIMANQIASFFASQPGDQAASVAAHINNFWAPSMRAELLETAKTEDARLNDLVRQALPLIKVPQSAR